MSSNEFARNLPTFATPENKKIILSIEVDSSKNLFNLSSTIKRLKSKVEGHLSKWTMGVQQGGQNEKIFILEDCESKRSGNKKVDKTKFFDKTIFSNESGRLSGHKLDGLNPHGHTIGYDLPIESFVI